ncbi:MAG: S9 family peptidase [Alteromonadaceae bacterium]|nr:S9 family peptidase [Alteromonadaceae bacterium]
MLDKIKKVITFTLFFISYCSMVTGQENNITENQSQEQNLEISTLFQQDDYRNVSLSPDGKHIALIRTQNDTPVLIIVAVETMKAINQISFAKKDSVGSYSWANNERLLIFLSSEQRNEERKAYYGEIYSINIDEDKGKFIFGVRSLVRRGKLKSKVTSIDYEQHFAHPRIISTLKNDPRHIIISTSRYGNRGMWVFKLDIYEGKLETLAKVKDYNANSKSTKLWYLDNSQELWLRTNYDNNITILARYDFDDKSWIEYRPKNASFNLSIISTYKDQKQLIVRDYCGNDTISICLFDPKTQQLSSLYQVDGYDVDWLHLDNQNTPFALSYFDEYSQYKILDKKHPMAETLGEFLKRFAGYRIGVKWDITKRQRVLVSLSRDVQPTVWYLFDSEKNKLTYVADSKKGLDAKQLHQQYSFKFQARDKTSIQGYLTLPTKTSNAPPPAVILVHGGPYSRDYWGFDPEVQLLSSQGYAVVQVNFRGSQGFGWEFESSGFKQWGENIQYDILDGINYLAEKQYIDINRLCIMGASFGGYSAMQSSILAPDLFKCTVARSGLYDLQLFVDEKSSKEALKLTKRIGSEDLQIAHSPVNAIDKLQTPVLVVHGTKDDRTPLEQADVLLEQLDKHNKTYEWFEIQKEGHSFHNAKNRIKYYEKVMQFINKYNPAVL